MSDVLPPVGFLVCARTGWTDESERTYENDEGVSMEIHRLENAVGIFKRVIDRDSIDAETGDWTERFVCTGYWECGSVAEARALLDGIRQRDVDAEVSLLEDE